MRRCRCYIAPMTIAVLLGWAIFLGAMMWMGEDGMKAFWLSAIVFINVASALLFFL